MNNYIFFDIFCWHPFMFSFMEWSLWGSGDRIEVGLGLSCDTSRHGLFIPAGANMGCSLIFRYITTTIWAIVVVIFVDYSKFDGYLMCKFLWNDRWLGFGTTLHCWDYCLIWLDSINGNDADGGGWIFILKWRFGCVIWHSGE